MIRKKRKNLKQRGLTNHKTRRRGAGNRGGRGMAGRGKKGSHRLTKDLSMGITLGKTKGFFSHNKVKLKTINLGDLMKLVKDGQVKTNYKVLSKGVPLTGVKVIAKAFSEKAKIKIEKAKGQAVVE